MLRNLIPHDSKVITLDLTGTQIRAILEQSVENTFSNDPRTKVGGMIQVSGLTFDFDPAGASNSRVLRVQVAGTDLEPHKIYRVVTNALLAQGGHRYEVFREGNNRQEHAPQYEIVKASLIKQKAIAPPAGERSKSAR